MGRAGRSLLGVLPLLAGLAGPVHAALPTYELTIRDGHFEPATIEAVSYTHLTLPTICSV